MKYFYIRNNLYIERSSDEDNEYLYTIYNSKKFNLDEKSEEFIKRTYLNVILDEPNKNGNFVNYGPDNKKFIRPTNSIIIGVRYDQFDNVNDDNIVDDYSNKVWQLKILMDYFEKRIKKESEVPFFVIKYDDYSVNSKKKNNYVKK